MLRACRRDNADFWSRGFALAQQLALRAALFGIDVGEFGAEVEKLGGIINPGEDGLGPPSEPLDWGNTRGGSRRDFCGSLRWPCGFVGWPGRCEGGSATWLPGRLLAIREFPDLAAADSRRTLFWRRFYPAEARVAGYVRCSEPQHPPPPTFSVSADSNGLASD